MLSMSAKTISTTYLDEIAAGDFVTLQEAAYALLAAGEVAMKSQAGPETPPPLQLALNFLISALLRRYEEKADTRVQQVRLQREMVVGWMLFAETAPETQTAVSPSA